MKSKMKIPFPLHRSRLFTIASPTTAATNPSCVVLTRPPRPGCRYCYNPLLSNSLSVSQRSHRQRQRHRQSIDSTSWRLQSPGGGKKFFSTGPRPTQLELGQGQGEEALKDVRILDLSRVLAGPYCTQILADYGADVIKVEHPGKGDDTRYWRAKGEARVWKEKETMSNYFASINRNKRSITVDLKQKRGLEILMELVRRSDVVVDNFVPGKMEELGIGYDTLSKVNPAIIHASVSGYGSSGPFGCRAGYDMIAGAEAGLLHITGEPDGPPTKPGLGLTDMTTGLYAHGAILAALHARSRTGHGQKINASLFETQISLLINVGLGWLNGGQEAQRMGTQHPNVVPYGAFPTKDAYLVLGATNPKQFSKICELIGAPELAQDERFRTNELRVQNRGKLNPKLFELFKLKTTEEWLAIFEGSGMPYGSVNNMEKVFSHPQTEARQMVKTVPFDASESGLLNLLGPAVKFSESEPTIRRAPPLLGQHTDEVLEELGYDGAAIGQLRELKVV